MDDTYEALGPNMRARLDKAELDMAKLRDYLGIVAERDRSANQFAREICVVLGVGPYRNWDAIAASRPEVYG